MSMVGWVSVSTMTSSDKLGAFSVSTESNLSDLCVSGCVFVALHSTDVSAETVAEIAVIRGNVAVVPCYPPFSRPQAEVEFQLNGTRLILSGSLVHRIIDTKCFNFNEFFIILLPNIDL